MDNFNASQVMSGTQGEIWIDGKYMAEVTAFKAEIKLIKEEVNQVKKMFKQYKVTGCEGTGNVKMNHVSSYFMNLLAENIKKARQTAVTIVVKLDDPDAVGAERISITDATFDKLTLMDWEAKKLTSDDYDFTFTEFDILDTAE
ncbi:phage tail tube protein [Phascolarctobacterium succinatutens]|uniref:phage tail tube protein n=1 Tax=Phascolarctobacterium succinatutens TaxID=626940 RepID=UPI0025CE14BD|nr:phage tail tube protein [Phascolarctobacterium succinatutens]